MDFSLCTKLLQELKSSHFLPPYNEELVLQLKSEMQKVQQKIRSIFEDIKSQPEKKQEYASHLIVLYTIILRHKRCILAYLNYRQEKIEEAYWEFGNFPQDRLQCLSNDEKAYLNDYKNMICQYQQKLPVELDLTKDVEPLHDIYIEVRVKKDIGDIVTQDGQIIKLTKNTQHYLKRQDIDHLILNGSLEPTGN